MATTVLIVEDDFILAKMTEMQLNKENYKVVGKADNAESAIELFCRHTPDMVLMDIQLKGEKDGIDAVTLLRRSQPAPVNVIFLTGNSDPVTKERAMKSGCSGYLIKPVDESVLLKSIRDALQHQN